MTSEKKGLVFLHRVVGGGIEGITRRWREKI